MKGRKQLTPLNRHIVLSPQTEEAIRKALDDIMALPERARLELVNGFAYGDQIIFIEISWDTVADRGLIVV